VSLLGDSVLRVLLQKALQMLYIATTRLNIQKAEYLGIETLFQCVQKFCTVKPLY